MVQRPGKMWFLRTLSFHNNTTVFSWSNRFLHSLVFLFFFFKLQLGASPPTFSNSNRNWGTSWIFSQGLGNFMKSLPSHAKIKGSKSLSSGCQLPTPGLGRCFPLENCLSQVYFHCFPLLWGIKQKGSVRDLMDPQFALWWHIPSHVMSLGSSDKKKKKIPHQFLSALLHPAIHHPLGWKDLRKGWWKCGNGAVFQLGWGNLDSWDVAFCHIWVKHKSLEWNSGLNSAVI